MGNLDYLLISVCACVVIFLEAKKWFAIARFSLFIIGSFCRLDQSGFYFGDTRRARGPSVVAVLFVPNMDTDIGFHIFA